MILPTLSINQYPQWVQWKLVDGSKYFVQPNGKAAKSNDPSTWSRLEDIDATHACFVLSKEDPFFGIDLDDCIDNDGRLNDQACVIVDAFKGKAYIERSQSKRGLHITGIGKKPEGSQSVFKDGNQRIEIYDHSRFWITTFDSYPDSAVILPCQAQLDDLIARLTKEPVVKEQSVKVSMGSGIGEIDRRARQYLQGIPVPTKGNINNTVFSVCGHLHSFRGSDSSKLSPEEILDLVWQWCGGTDKDLTREYVWERVKTSATCGTARELKYPTSNYQPIDPVEIVEIDLSGEKDEEELIDEWVPTSGLIRMVYDFYHEVAVFPSPIMGMATAIAAMEVVLGQRLQTETGLRTNDLNVVLGPTGCGKEAVEKTISKIFDAANYLDMIMPAGVQSGNGLLGYLSENPVALWVKDEFGVYLENVFGKRKQPMEAQVGRFLLELYNKADTRYSGNAHASGSKNVIEQPHLVLLGMSTYGTIFDTLSFKDVENGLLNRMAFWCVTQQPAMKEQIKLANPPEELVARVKEWLELRPVSTTGRPDPIILIMTSEARKRWNDHRIAIHDRKDREDTGRASMWSRTAARSLKFALCSAASRIPGPGAICDGRPPEIEIEDVNWGIKLSNWLSRSACNLIAANTTDSNRGRAEMAILDFARKSSNWVNLREIQRLRRIVRGDLVAAAERLASDLKIDFQRQPYGKRERLMVRLIRE